MAVIYKSLQGTVQRVEEELKALDANNLEHRAIVLDAISALVRNVVIPAIPLAKPDGDGHTSFDLDAVAGCEVSGFLLDAFFTPRFPDLQKPSDEILRRALVDVGIDLSSIKDRDAFFRVWAAEQATMSAESLLAFLSKAPTQRNGNVYTSFSTHDRVAFAGMIGQQQGRQPYSSSRRKKSLEKEISRLEGLLSDSLPHDLVYWIVDALVALSPQRAENFRTRASNRQVIDILDRRLGNPFLVKGSDDDDGETADVNGVSLRTTERRVSALLDGIDATKPANRAAVLEAIDVLVTTNIVPNIGLASRGDNGQVYFNTDAVVGRTAPILALDDVFASRFADLKKPDDKTLCQALNDSGITIPTPDGRDAFFRVWAGGEATASADTLVAFLQTSPRQSTVTPRDAQRLERLLAHPLPGDLKLWIVSTIVTLVRDRVTDLRARTSDSYVAQLLDAAIS